MLYCAAYYDNKYCSSVEEFTEDLRRIKYIKKLLTRYLETGELKERLILNHLTILKNVFGPEHTCRIVMLKMKQFLPQIKPFLILLSILPDKVVGVETVDSVIHTDTIPMDQKIVGALRQI